MADCSDVNCPVHGKLSTRGAILEGTVVSDKMEGTVTVYNEYTVKSPKFERYKRRHSKIMAHNPPCMEVKIGDKVKIAECRPLSRKVHFVVVEKTAAS